MKKKGFTLIELLVVVAIIGLLATLTIVALNSSRARARDAKRVADVKQVHTALALYFIDNGAYPDSIDFTAGNTGIGTNSVVYMSKAPTAPIPFDGNCDTTSNLYVYNTSDALKTYTISYCLGNATGGIASGVGTATPAGIK